eukprot:Rhum_TRINITY_DN13939_c0_g1::Rhum_TRINITY_DN13939_c0_g1_i3::g.65630::m.65630/K03164/TOP2; DNA topoisomerase II
MMRRGALRAWHTQCPLTLRCAGNVPAQLRHFAETANSMLDQKYVVMSQRDHVLKRPDMYVGSTHFESHKMWVMKNTQIESSKYEVVEYVPALAKIFDEILVNVADNYHRSFETAGGEKATTQMQVWVDREKGTVSIKNDGKCIDVAIHPTAGIYCPELVFGNFQAGSNFDDTQKRITGGRNGIGAKAANVLSDVFTIAIGDSEHRKEYQQEWRHSMAEKGSPIITEGYRGSDYTQVTFTPHYDYFGMDGLDDAHEYLFYRRVADVAACCRGLSVTLNNHKLSHSFVDYVEARYKAIENTADAVTHEEDELDADADDDEDGDDKAPHRYVHSVSLKHLTTGLPWEVCVGPGNPGDSLDLSFVNAINTTEHGTHFNIVQMQVVGAFRSHILLEYGYDLPVSFVRDRVRVFVNCLVENPEFNGQCKARLTHPSIASLRNDVQLPQDFLKQICDDDAILQPIVTAWALKTQIEGSGVKRRAKPFAEKLEDAKKAGTRESRECTLILVEGDSAKSLAVAGLQSLQRDYWGVYPLRGKLMNVKKRRTLKSEQSNLDKLESVLGLDREKTYETEEELDTLRYGSIAVMTDQDHDGSHIKGLIIAWLSHYWPQLLRKPLLKSNGSSVPFLRSIVTPLVKVFTDKPKDERWFYSLSDYAKWQAKHEGRFRAKYYKGLGSSTSAEGREYFARLFNNDRPMLINFEDLTETDLDAIEDAFGENADRRKVWLSDNRSSPLDTSGGEVSINSFVNTDVASYFHYINLERALPSCIDGLKPSQRKVLFTCFKRDLTGHKEMKVSQLSGAVAELTCYHHGDMSMHETIVKLAQDFVGSGNNVPLLEPLGQFGTRLAGGSDHASARYISTRLSPLVRMLFREEDDELLEMRTEEGREIEPVTYVPILPMVLVNGANGIGSGYSCKISSHDPLAVAGLLFELLSSEKKMRAVQKAGAKREKLDSQCAAIEKKLFQMHIAMSKLHGEEALGAWDRQERRTLAAAGNTQKAKAEAKASTAKANGKAKKSKAKNGPAKVIDAATIARKKEKFLTQFFRKKVEAHPEGVNLIQKLATARTQRVEDPAALTPWYHGHKVGSCPDQVSAGMYKQISPHTDVIEELPVGVWTDTFIEFLEGLLTNKKIRGYTSDCTEKSVSFSVRYNSDEARTLVRSKLRKLDHTNPTLIDPSLRSTLNVHTDLLYVVTNIYIPRRLALYEARRTSQQTTLQENLDEQKSVLELLNFLRAAHTNNQPISLDAMRQAGIEDPVSLSRKVSSAELLLANDGSVTRRVKTVKRLEQKISDVVSVSAQQLWQQELVAFAHAYVAHFESCPDDIAKRLTTYPKFKSLVLKETTLEVTPQSSPEPSQLSPQPSPELPPQK